MSTTVVFTGSYTQPIRLGTGELVEARGEGICMFRLDENGLLTKLASCDAPNPSYLALHPGGRHLYAVNELKEFIGLPSAAVSAYELDAQSGTLRLLNRQPTGGEDACNLSFSPCGRYLMAANYTGGSLCVFPLEADHSIGRPSCFFQHNGSGPDPLRQSAPHVHQVIADASGKHVLAVDLGTDEVAVYGADWKKGLLIPKAPIRTAPGLGPRLCVFDETGRRMYLIAELGNAVCVYDYDAQSGSAALLQTISTLPEGDSTQNIAACIRLHPNGRLLFASNRGHDSIAVYRIGEDGLLALLCIHKTGGQTPRDFAITPAGDFLVVGHQDSHDLTVFAIDAQSGALSEVSRTACGSVTSVHIARL